MGTPSTEPHIHTFDQETIKDAALKTPATCTSPAVYYKSCTCGENGTETFESGEVNTSNHTGTPGDWQTNSGKHWKVYSCCGAKVEEGTHVYTDDTDATCNTCGYERTITSSHTHSWATAWSKDDTHHWHNCTAEGCDVTENSGKDGYGTHDYTDDTDTTCNTCDYERTVAHEHAITVINGKATVGAGTEISKAAEGTTVTLTANAAPTDKVFDKWEVVSGSIKPIR